MVNHDSRSGTCSAFLILMDKSPVREVWEISHSWACFAMTRALLAVIRQTVEKVGETDNECGSRHHRRSGSSHCWQSSALAASLKIRRNDHPFSHRPHRQPMVKGP